MIWINLFVDPEVFLATRFQIYFFTIVPDPALFVDLSSMIFIFKPFHTGRVVGDVLFSLPVPTQ